MMEELPSNWKRERLGNLCLKTNSKDPRNIPDISFIYVDVSSISNQSFCIVETKSLMGRDAPSRARKLVRKDDVIFATVRPTLKRVALVTDEFDGQICSTGFCVLRAIKEHLDPVFLYYYLLTEKVINSVDGLQKGATYPAISDSDLFNQVMSLPPLHEQQAISHVLRAVQQARETRLHEIALERERKAALMEHLFTHGTRGEPTKITEIGEMPKSWQLETINDICSNIIDYRGKTPEFSDSGIIHLRSSNIKNGKIILDGITYLSEETYKAFMTRGFPKAGDIIFTMEGPLGEAAQVPYNFRFSLAQRMIVLQANERILDSMFLMYALYSKSVKISYMGRATGSTVKGISSKIFRKVKLPLPSISEQRNIANFLHACDVRISSLDNEIQLLDELFRAMLEELMTGRLSTASLIETEAIS